MERPQLESSLSYDSLVEEEISTNSLPTFAETNVQLVTPCEDISKYEKLNTISEGSFGIVFRAKLTKDVSPERFFAVKKLKGKYTTSKEGFSRPVLRELDILRNCCHQNVVKVIEVCVDDAQDVYLVMEYVPTDVKNWQRSLPTRKEQLSMAHVKNILRQLLSGISYLHDHSLVHRDLKTSNLLLTLDGVLKLCDFGLCRTVPNDNSDKEPWTPQVMTMLYRCPEVLMREQSLYSQAIDIWSAGIIFAELVLGHPPFVKCMKEPLQPDSKEAELEMFHELVDNLGSPSCVNDYIRNSYGKSIVSDSDVSRDRPFALQEELKLKLSTLGVDLLLLLLHWDPRQRPSAADALHHPFFAEEPLPCSNSELPDIVISQKKATSEP